MNKPPRCKLFKLYSRRTQPRLCGMKKRYIPCASAAKKMTTQELRQSFLIDDLFENGRLNLYYTDCDRAVIGGAVPLETPLKLESADELRAQYFCERREFGALNIGGAGFINADGKKYALAKNETLYVGRGAKEIEFGSDFASAPARFYIVSYPAHAAYPVSRSGLGEGNILHLGSKSTCNERDINQVICEARIKSAQLVMGHTHLAEGSVWNTMPVHTHERRSEVYMYYDVPEGAFVFHFAGAPDETRHIIVSEGQVVISPSWSIHSGCGIANYSFCWAMGGENQRFDDMDGVKPEDLK